MEPMQPDVSSQPVDEARIRRAARVAVRSCRECECGPECMGALMDLVRYLPPEVKRIVEDEQARALEQMVGGD